MGLAHGPGTGVVGASAASWVPTALSGCVLWLRADLGVLNAGGNPAANGEKVATWQDQSGNGRHCTQSTDANRPTYVTSAFGSKPALDFDNSDDYLEGAWGGATYSQFSIFAVCQQDTTGNHAIFDTTDATLTNRCYNLYQEGNTREFRTAAAGSDAQTTFTSTSIMSCCGIETSTIDRKIRINDTTEATNSTSRTAATINNYRVGRLFQNVFPWDGKICELVALSRNATSGEVTTVTGYFTNFWGIV